MAFGGLSGNQSNQPVAEINMIPLIDVMLVLLIIFIVTAPLLSHAVKIDLPKATSEASNQKQEDIQLSIDATGKVFWNQDPLIEGDWNWRMKSAASRSPQPELHIRADENLPYKRVVQIMTDASVAGLSKIGFVTEPAPVGR